MLDKLAALCGGGGHLNSVCDSGEDGDGLGLAVCFCGGPSLGYGFDGDCAKLQTAVQRRGDAANHGNRVALVVGGFETVDGGCGGPDLPRKLALTEPGCLAHVVNELRGFDVDKLLIELLVGGGSASDQLVVELLDGRGIEFPAGWHRHESIVLIYENASSSGLCRVRRGRGFLRGCEP